MKPKFSIIRVTVVSLAIVFALTATAWFFGYLQPLGVYRPSNALMVIQPYKYAGTWVFDDRRVGLEQEPFISGIPEMMDLLSKDIPNAENGFRLLFSTKEFPGYMVMLTKGRPERGGNWYYCEALKKEGWLCPALLRYYKEAPEHIYAKAEAK